jgi:hypothetical protein
VAGLRVGQQVVEQVVVAGALPEMMVRIDDRQRGLERLLASPWRPTPRFGAMTLPRLSP